MIPGAHQACSRLRLPLITIALIAAAACSGISGHRPPCRQNAYVSTAKHCVPNAWQCSPALYAAGAADGCDCNCGAKDPDCRKNAKTFWCYGLGMARQVTDCRLCGQAPGERELDALWATQPNL